SLNFCLVVQVLHSPFPLLHIWCILHYPALCQNFYLTLLYYLLSLLGLLPCCLVCIHSMCILYLILVLLLLSFLISLVCSLIPLLLLLLCILSSLLYRHSAMIVYYPLSYI